MALSGTVHRMSDQPEASRPISMSVSGPVPLVLPPEPTDLMADIARARSSADPASELRVVVARHPSSLFAWSALGDAETDPTLRYACYRVGYHRGLDSLRANGWRGSGDVRWSEPSNHGFLRALLGLHVMSAAIGDTAEAERTLQFLAQLDRSGVPRSELDSLPAP